MGIVGKEKEGRGVSEKKGRKGGMMGRKAGRKRNEKIKLTDSLVHGGIDHGTKLGEARLPHDVGGALHPF